ncbi:hypothetical protein HaLaN_01433 [Haematococcus lacustris]|uniref:Protein kinase domain-containing protein n=1 Tax=Haematococcus lacustris TaxID=44745 RepID=A0A699YL85_HAELA|nr:hypothetical protein HaLaN_01433 [Haematococcus lacustris]
MQRASGHMHACPSHMLADNNACCSDLYSHIVPVAGRMDHVADFGLSRLVKEHQAESPLGQPCSVWGTPAYVSTSSQPTCLMQPWRHSLLGAGCTQCFALALHALYGCMATAGCRCARTVCCIQPPASRALWRCP